uniref:General secretion pathway protein D n=1 Tax=Candidatus Kentrum sp. FM TaxID=2126340 RepID=A0A450S8C0_9GAMM|nr:MAG: general secretion pathway protein D [Candidatus Kentron sp. FM]VFJ48071.1 MAG: general secretion pathway protein D [Candidatus Kentron sp. FM]VFK06398.1 MAG: general secretion pathway protein D [Candidatus Kentron sp. FM]
MILQTEITRLLICLLVYPLIFPVTACTTPPSSAYIPSSGHIQEAQPGTQPADAAIPEPVQHTHILPPSTPSPPPETYTIVVSDVPVKELLFALARDTGINIDIHPGIEGVVTVNAIDQTLPEVLARIESQVSVRHEFRGETLVIMPDIPFLKTYRVDYVNMHRTSSSEVRTSTKVATSASVTTSDGGKNASNILVSNVSGNRFWETLTANIIAILGQGSSSRQEDGGTPDSNSVIVNAETGLLTVRATAKQHRDIRSFIHQVMVSARRQVLIEATIVEVELNDRYQSGIDWGTFTTGAGLQVSQAVMGSFPLNLSTENTTGLTVDYANASLDSEKLNLSLTVKLLQQFGHVRVLSSPKIMTLNNQTALLKVVDNEVYFELEVEERENEETNTVDLTVKSKIKTVPVGLLMNVTPQIDHQDFVTLNVRPTITRIKEYREDPGVAIVADRLADSDISSKVPVVQVRETESVLEVKSRQIAVIGGLMQDRMENDEDSVPWLGEIPAIGNLFKFRHRNLVKTELVIFLRPTVVRKADVKADLSDFRQFLREAPHRK